MSVSMKAEEVASALKEWIVLDIKEAPSRIFQVARFLFGVSATSIGLIVSISTFWSEAWTIYEYVSLLLFIAACGAALHLALPSIVNLDANTDLADIHAAMVKRARNHIVFWGLCWVLAVICFVFPKFKEIFCSEFTPAGLWLIWHPSL